MKRLIARIHARAAGLPPAFSARVTGNAILLGDTVDALSRGQGWSLLAAAAAIYLILALYLGSPRLGLLALAPNLLPVVFYFGLLGWTGITLNPATALAACIVLGVAVDDTIHYIARFREETLRAGNPEDGSIAALSAVVRPVTYTSLILCVGFLLFTTSAREPLVEFGALAALTIAFAWFTDVTFTPALCVSMTRGRLRRKDKAPDTEKQAESCPTSPPS